MTRSRRMLHLYVPVRYYHRPRGIDHAHGYGKPSRFLTDAVRSTCDATRPDGLGRLPLDADGAPRKINVSIERLFQ